MTDLIGYFVNNQPWTDLETMCFSVLILRGCHWNNDGCPGCGINGKKYCSFSLTITTKTSFAPHWRKGGIRNYGVLTGGWDRIEKYKEICTHFLALFTPCSKMNSESNIILHRKQGGKKETKNWQNILSLLWCNCNYMKLQEHFCVL